VGIPFLILGFIYLVLSVARGAELILPKVLTALHFNYRYIHYSETCFLMALVIFGSSVDIDKNKVAKAKLAAEAKGLLEDSTVMTYFTSNDYQEEIQKLTKVFKDIKREKAFVFIDPYGYKHIKASDIKKTLQSKIAEVLLFLPTQFMYRFDQNGTPESLKDFIDELVEYKNWKENDSVWEFINQLTSAFRLYMGEDYFVDTFTIRKDSNTVFCLFFFSSHIRGFEKMLESKWEIDKEEGRGWEYNGNGPSLFYDQRTNQLEEKLNVYLQESRTNGEVYEYTLHCGFLPTHAVEVLSSWQKNGHLEVKLPDGASARKNSFYISYDHFKNETKKVTIKRK
jgi:three-Cys-motif partner protein